MSRDELLNAFQNLDPEDQEFVEEIVKTLLLKQAQMAQWVVDFERKAHEHFDAQMELIHASQQPPARVAM